jgi:hypothetical protein
VGFLYVLLALAKPKESVGFGIYNVFRDLCGVSDNKLKYEEAEPWKSLSSGPWDVLTGICLYGEMTDLLGGENGLCKPRGVPRKEICSSVSVLYLPGNISCPSL